VPKDDKKHTHTMSKSFLGKSASLQLCSDRLPRLRMTQEQRTP
jgi:hypothetical protein